MTGTTGGGASNAEWLRRAAVFLCALAVALPLARRGNSCGHDFDFHIQSWLAAAGQWHQGSFYPHWFEAGNYGAGEPRFVFYPPLSWTLGALLGMVLGWPAAPIAYTLLVLTACGFSMKRLAREWLPPNAAAVAACAYILNPYALFVAYERTAYAELAAGVWLPLILLFALRTTSRRSNHQRAGGSEPQGPSAIRENMADAPRLALETWEIFGMGVIPLALVIAAVWLTNAPSAVMACYALAAIAGWQAISQRRLGPVLNSAVSLSLGLGLASFYIVPAAYERRWVDIARAIGPGMRIEDSFLFARTGESFHDMVLRTASWIFVTMLVAIVAALAVSRTKTAAAGLLLPLSVTAAALFALQLRWSQVLWHLVPELRYLQFPWRWSLVLSVVFALSIGAVVTRRAEEKPELSFRVPAVAILLSSIAAVSLGSQLFWQPCDEEDAVSAQVAVFQSGSGFAGTDEYTPLGADNSLLPQGLPQVRILKAADGETAAAPAADDQDTPDYAPSPQEQIPTAGIQVEQWLAERKSLTVNSPAAGYAVLRLLDYPAWRLRANGEAVGTRPQRDDGLMTVPIRPGITHIDVSYAATPDIRIGRALGALSLLGLSALAFLSRRRRQLG